jgi:hypothetical protein
MRRYLLFLTVPSVSAWAQPPQRDQAPTVVQVEMPPRAPRDFFEYLQSLGPLSRRALHFMLASRSAAYRSDN